MKRVLPPLPEAPLAQRCWIAVKALPELGKLPLTATLSYPVPGPRGLLHFFHVLPAMRSGDNQRLLTRLTVKLPGLAITEMRKATDSALFPGLPAEVPAVATRHSPGAEPALFEAYSKLLERWPEREAGPLGPQFLETLTVLVPAPLVPYYKALNPAFFEWCERA